MPASEAEQLVTVVVLVSEARTDIREVLIRTVPWLLAAAATLVVTELVLYRAWAELLLLIASMLDSMPTCCSFCEGC